MAIPHAAPGEIIDVRPWGDALPKSVTKTLIKTNTLEVIRLVVPGGKKLPPHKVAGEVLVQCLEGRIALTALGRSQTLQAGEMVYLSGAEEHAVEGIEDASALVTILL